MKFIRFHSRKCIWKWRLENDGHFFGLSVLNHWGKKWNGHHFVSTLNAGHEISAVSIWEKIDWAIMILHCILLSALFVKFQCLKFLLKYNPLSSELCVCFQFREPDVLIPYTLTISNPTVCMLQFFRQRFLLYLLLWYTLCLGKIHSFPSNLK